MDLTDDDIREFQQIWRDEFGEDLPADDMRHCISLLLELMALVVRPLPPAAVPSESPKDEPPHP